MFFIALLSSHPNGPQYSFFCPVQAPNSKKIRLRETKIGVNILQGSSNRCTNFQFKGSEVRRFEDGSIIWQRCADIRFQLLHPPRRLCFCQTFFACLSVC